MYRIIISAVLVLILLYLYFRIEHFSNDAEKDAAILGWFKSPHTRKNYINFRKDLNRNDKLEVDIVDYQRAKNAIYQ